MKFDLHSHTYYSDDAVMSPDLLIRSAKAAGIGGIALTDHNNTRGWKEAISAGKKHKIDVIKGEEVKVLVAGKKIGEVLALFITEQINPGEFSEVADKIHSQGGILVVAHPFDFLRNRFKEMERWKKHFDGVEVFNSRVIFGRLNRKAMDFAKRNRLAVTGGSDSHCRFEVGNAYTEADVTDQEGLFKAIKKRKTTAYGKRTNPFVHSLSVMTKIGIMRTGH